MQTPNEKQTNCQRASTTMPPSGAYKTPSSLPQYLLSVFNPLDSATSFCGMLLSAAAGRGGPREQSSRMWLLQCFFVGWPEVGWVA